MTDLIPLLQLITNIQRDSDPRANSSLLNIHQNVSIIESHPNTQGQITIIIRIFTMYVLDGEIDYFYKSLD